MEPTFPLFRLPENVIVQVLQNMNPDRLFFISLVLSKTKSLVTSLGLRARNVRIYISNEIALYVSIGRFAWNFIFSNNSNNQNAEFDITLPISASTLPLRKDFQLSTPFTFSDCLDHIGTVFCCTNLLAVAFEPGSEQFKMESLKTMLKNINCLTISERVTHIQSKQILKSFKDLNELTLESNPFEDTCEVQKLFIQNLKVIRFNDAYSLDDMLLANSVRVDLCHPISQKQFNQFVKHWIRGSNPRLQRMSLSIVDSNSVSREVLLKGIQCVDVTEEKQQEICRKHRILSDYMVQIRRKDGTPAVIATKDYENIFYISFFVFY
ncbi:hypothetical protein CRE_06112 [Caenorhabditis remanei]|uniref:F-box domain-containing protein n=1 Tax=Caenorhabditis remanei TaxID=31234 RepID=E3NED7_CAERE|nr:hypothetical protein CRE_06112 [Caenorhabditis remanei]